MTKYTLVGNDTAFSRNTFKFKRAKSCFSVSHCLTSWLHRVGLVTCTVPDQFFFPAFISERRQEVSRRPTRSELDMTHKLYTRRGVLHVNSTLRPCIRVARKTLGQYAWAQRCRGREWQGVNVSVWKGGVLEEKQGESLPAIGPAYTKCKEILGLLIPFLKLCSDYLSLQWDKCTYSAFTSWSSRWILNSVAMLGSTNTLLLYE